MFDVNKYVDKIVGSIDGVKTEQEELKNIIESYIEEKKEVEEIELEQYESLEFDIESEEIEVLNVQESEENTFTEFEVILIEKLNELKESNNNIEVRFQENQELLIQQENSMVEGFWMLTIILALSIGFKIFFDNILKW